MMNRHERQFYKLGLLVSRGWTFVKIDERTTAHLYRGTMQAAITRTGELIVHDIVGGQLVEVSESGAFSLKYS